MLHGAWLAVAAIFVLTLACTNEYDDFEFVDDDGTGGAAGSVGSLGSAGAVSTTGGAEPECDADLLEDRENCGACGNECPKGFACDEGQCVCDDDDDGDSDCKPGKGK